MMFFKKHIGWLGLGTAMLVVIATAFFFGLEPAQADEVSNDDGEMTLQMYRRQVLAEEKQAKALEAIATELKEIKRILKKR